MASAQPISQPSQRGVPVSGPNQSQSQSQNHQANSNNINNFSQAVSPPSREQLKSWWNKFGRKKDRPDEQGQWTTTPDTRYGQLPVNQGIFGVPLDQSIRYANVAISLSNEQGESFIYGFVPIVVAKCGVFLKEKATDVEGIFRLSGSAKRIKDLQLAFNSPDRYGKGLDWTGYTVHDAANILRRYLNQLPEPIVPLDFYERFRQPLRSYQTKAGNDAQPQAMENEEHAHAVAAYQRMITELPPLNRQLLLYILDLLAVFASKSELNRMTAQNLAAIFQPGIISHPKDDMAPSEYRLSQDVLIFLIDNQDHFLIGMSGTAMDEKTQDEVKSGTPSLRNQPSKPSVDRSTSNASAGADSLRKAGGVRRNASLSSHNSRDRSSPAVSVPGTPVTPSALTIGTGTTGGIARSNTVPSNRSPAMPGTSRFQRGADGNSPSTPSSAHPNSVAPHMLDGALPDDSLSNQTDVPGTETQTPIPSSTTPPASSQLSKSGPSHLTVSTTTDDQLPDPAAAINAAHEPRSTQDTTSTTPGSGKPITRERKISNLLSISSPIFGPSDQSKDPNQRQPRKLQKRRNLPGSSNESAQSSQASLNVDDAGAFHTPSMTPNHLTLEHANPVDSYPYQGSNRNIRQSSEQPYDTVANSPSGLRDNRNMTTGLRPPHSPTMSIHSRGSATDPSDLDGLEDAAVRAEKRKHRFTLSKRDSTPLAPPPPIGLNSGARTSNSSLGSNRPRKSFTGDSLLTSTSGADATSGGYYPTANASSRDSGELAQGSQDADRKGFFGRIKAKMQQSRDDRERAKSPPRLQGDQGSRSSLTAFAHEHLSPRGRSFDKSREGSLTVAEDRFGHSRSGSKTPVPPQPQAQWTDNATILAPPPTAPHIVPAGSYAVPDQAAPVPVPANVPSSSSIHGVELPAGSASTLTSAPRPQSGTIYPPIETSNPAPRLDPPLTGVDARSHAVQMDSSESGAKAGAAEAGDTPAEHRLSNRLSQGANILDAANEGQRQRQT